VSAGAPAAAAGAAFAVAAYGFWGVAPLYFRWLEHVGALQVVAHRVLWTALLLIPLLALVGGLGRLRAVAADARALRWLALSGVLIGGNWLLFVHAILAERVLEASLGYFVNPLVSLLLGVFFLGERPRPLQWIAVGLAALGVGNELLRYGAPPWLGLALAFSFGFYGLVRKRLSDGVRPVDSFTGLTVESWLLLPLALAFLLWNGAVGTDAFTRDAGDAALLVLAGPVTMLPLLCFAAAAARLTLGTLGFFQYLAPTLQFLLAVFVFGEPFAPGQWGTFGLIWAALVLFSASALHERRRLRRARLVPEPAPS
jgi:chloramphenicol-sensitive protein RarD